MARFGSHLSQTQSKIVTIQITGPATNLLRLGLGLRETCVHSPRSRDSGAGSSATAPAAATGRAPPADATGPAPHAAGHVPNSHKTGSRTERTGPKGLLHSVAEVEDHVRANGRVRHHVQSTLSFGEARPIPAEMDFPSRAPVKSASNSAGGRTDHTGGIDGNTSRGGPS